MYMCFSNEIEVLPALHLELETTVNNQNLLGPQHPTQRSYEGNFEENMQSQAFGRTDSLFTIQGSIPHDTRYFSATKVSTPSTSMEMGSV